jgi:predicted regulator of Ras-like GTPase activity (Roadblock/LC7/MglB family)
MKLQELTKIPKVLGAGVATKDGFIVESQFAVGYDPEKFGAMAARIVNQINKSLKAETSSIILYAPKMVFFARAKADGIIFAIGYKDANLGLLKIKFDKI